MTAEEADRALDYGIRMPAPVYLDVWRVRAAVVYPRVFEARFTEGRFPTAGCLMRNRWGEA